MYGRVFLGPENDDVTADRDDIAENKNERRPPKFSRDGKTCNLYIYI